ncbi:DUF4129 domain-containing protein, partial [Streptomyces sp. NPDC020406]|uniref:DUF4129 domain-containing protein n=1 Tax=Streptomyces sp. NPDC020406 TaxID=3365072 RepID=UPI00379BCCEA
GRGRGRPPRRRGGGGPARPPPPPPPATGRVMAAWREVTDTAWDHGIAPDESQTPRKAAARVVRLGRLDGAAAAAVHRLAGAVEQVLYAAEPRAVTGTADDVSALREGLWASAGRLDRLRATFAPRSAVRVVWALSERRTALAHRWARRPGRDRWSARLRRPSRQQG